LGRSYNTAADMMRVVVPVLAVVGLRLVLQ
jgi:hypothetical protein